MSEDKKSLLQKVIDLKLKKAEIEKALGMPVNSLSAMCSGKKELPTKYVEPLRLYLAKVEGRWDEEQIATARIELKNAGETFFKHTATKPINDLNFSIPLPQFAVIYDSEGKPINETEIPKREEQIKGGITFKKGYLTLTSDDPLYEAMESLAEEYDKHNPAVNPSVIESFLKSEGITPEQLIEGYKRDKSERSKPMKTFGPIFSNSPRFKTKDEMNEQIPEPQKDFKSPPTGLSKTDKLKWLTENNK